MMIRPATPDDVDRIREIILSAYADVRSQLKDMPDVAGGIEAEIVAERLWVLEDGEDLVGILNAFAQDGGFHIINIAVDPQSAGGGLGRRLMEFAETRAKAVGLSELRLATHAKMAGTRRFYARLGWDEIGQDGNKVLLRKQLQG